MGRVRKFGKGKFYGNRYTKPSSESMNVTPVSNNTNGITSTPESASRRKLVYLEGEGDDSFSVNSAMNGNVIIDLSIISSLINSVLKCKNCESENSILIYEDETARKGLASKLTLKCSECDNKESAMSSKKVNKGYEINIRMCYAMRCIGKGRMAADTFCAVMNLPPPPAKFSTYTNVLLEGLKTVAETSMKNAVKETVSLNDDCTDIAAAFDGTWHKRGHTSLNGVVTATSLETGKVIDVACLSKFCHKCSVGKSTPHNCEKNYEGYSGGMESNGVLTIFRRSEEERGVQYIQYLGDGDSKGFLKVQEANVYGAKKIEKLECCGHVQKRMGSRLRKLRNEYKGKKLEDGKPLSGRGRLTDTQINLLQQYYGLAIRRNAGSKSVKDMRKEVWATFFHKLSTDENPVHGLCPQGKDSWCRFNKAAALGENYCHKNSLPASVMTCIKPIYRDLSDERLLSKCMHGKTQNPNESFHHCIWERIPKTIFVSGSVLKIGVYDAIICFNDGMISRKKVLEQLGINAGRNMESALCQIDAMRLRKADYDAENMSKEARMKRRAMKRKAEDEEKLKQDEYGAGNY